MLPGNRRVDMHETACLDHEGPSHNMDIFSCDQFDCVDGTSVPVPQATPCKRIVFWLSFLLRLIVDIWMIIMMIIIIIMMEIEIYDYHYSSRSDIVSRDSAWAHRNISPRRGIRTKNRVKLIRISKLILFWINYLHRRLSYYVYSFIPYIYPVFLRCGQT